MILSWDLSDWKDFASIISAFATFVAILIGGGWFVYTWQLGRRSLFDLECSFYSLDKENNVVVAEIRFIVENKGLVKQDVYGFSLSVKGLESVEALEVDSSWKGLKFGRELFREDVIPMQDAAVRPTIRRVFSHIIKLDKPGPLVLLSSSFSFAKDSPSINKVEQLFRITDVQDGK